MQLGMSSVPNSWLTGTKFVFEQRLAAGVLGLLDSSSFVAYSKDIGFSNTIMPNPSWAAASAEQERQADQTSTRKRSRRQGRSPFALQRKGFLVLTLAVMLWPEKLHA